MFRTNREVMIAKAMIGLVVVAEIASLVTVNEKAIVLFTSMLLVVIIKIKELI